MAWEFLTIGPRGPMNRPGVTAATMTVGYMGGGGNGVQHENYDQGNRRNAAWCIRKRASPKLFASGACVGFGYGAVKSAWAALAGIQSPSTAAVTTLRRKSFESGLVTQAGLFHQPDP